MIPYNNVVLAWLRRGKLIAGMSAGLALSPFANLYGANIINDREVDVARPGLGAGVPKEPDKKPKVSEAPEVPKVVKPKKKRRSERMAEKRAKRASKKKVWGGVFGRGLKNVKTEIYSLLEQGRDMEAEGRLERFENFCKNKRWEVLGKSSKSEVRDRLAEVSKLRKLIEKQGVYRSKSTELLRDIIDGLVSYGDEVKQGRGKESFYDIDEDQFTGPLEDAELDLRSMKKNLKDYEKLTKETLYKEDDKRVEGLERRVIGVLDEETRYLKEGLEAFYNQEYILRSSIGQAYEEYNGNNPNVPSYKNNAKKLSEVLTYIDKIIEKTRKLQKTEKGLQGIYHNEILEEMRGRLEELTSAKGDLEAMADSENVPAAESDVGKSVGDLIAAKKDYGTVEEMRWEAEGFMEDGEPGKAVRVLKKAMKVAPNENKFKVREELSQAKEAARKRFEKLVTEERYERVAYGTRMGPVRVFEDFSRESIDGRGAGSANLWHNRVGVEARLNDKMLDEMTPNTGLNRLYGVLDAYWDRSYGVTGLKDTSIERTVKVVEIGGGVKFLYDEESGRYLSAEGGMEHRDDESILKSGKHGSKATRTIKGVSPFAGAAINGKNYRLWSRINFPKATERNSLVLERLGMTFDSPDKEHSGQRYRAGIEAFNKGNTLYGAAEVDCSNVTNGLGHTSGYELRARLGVAPLTKVKHAGFLRHARFELHGAVGRYQNNTYRTERVGVRAGIPLWINKQHGKKY